jgi:hypothetical protein
MDEVDQQLALSGQLAQLADPFGLTLIYRRARLTVCWGWFGSWFARANA